MKNRKSLYNDSSIQLIREDDHYVLVTKQENVKIENRTYDEDQKAMLEGATVVRDARNRIVVKCKNAWDEE